MPDSNGLRVSLAQISPHWLDRAATLEKVDDFVREAAGQGLWGPWVGPELR